MTASRTTSRVRSRFAPVAKLLLALLLGALPLRCMAAQAQPAAAQSQLATEQAQLGAPQAPPSPERFADLHCGGYTISVELRVQSWRYCDSYYYSLKGSGPVPWNTEEFAAPVTALGIAPIDSEPAVVALLENGTLRCLRCDGTPLLLYDVGLVVQPRPLSMFTGTISAESPQLRLFGVGKDGNNWAIFGFDLDIAELDDVPPIGVRPVRWLRRFDGVDLPLDQASMRGIWMSGNDVAVESAEYDQDGNCLFGPSPWYAWVTYKLDGVTGTLLQPGWAGTLEIDPEVPGGTGVRTVASDGSVAWTVDFASRVFAVGQFPYTRRGWRGGALVDADSLSGAPPRLFLLTATGTATQVAALKAVPEGTETDDRAIGGFTIVGSSPTYYCGSNPWGMLLVHSVSAGVARVMAVDITDLWVRDVGTFRGQLRDHLGWQFLVGQDRSGHAAAMSCSFVDCFGASSTLVLDGSSFGRPAETSFERLEDLPEQGEVVAVAASGHRHHFIAGSFVYRPLPTDRLTFEGSTLRAWSHEQQLLAEVELPAPIVVPYGFWGRATCLLRGVHGPAVATLEAADDLRLYRYEELTAEGCPASVAGLSNINGPTAVASGQDYILYSSLFTQTPFSSFVHRGPLNQETSAWLGPAGTSYQLLLGRVGDNGSPDITCVDGSLLTSHLGACAAVPLWTARWDGSQPGRPARSEIQGTSSYTDGGVWYLAVAMPGSAIELVGESGQAVPASTSLLAYGQMQPGDEEFANLRVRRVPSLQNAEVHLAFDPAVFELRSVSVVAGAQQRGFTVGAWAVVHGTARLTLSTPSPLPLNVGSLDMVAVRIRVRPDAPPGTSTILVAPSTQLRRADGSPFDLQLAGATISIGCPPYDVDLDGAVTVADAILALRQVVGLDVPTPRQQCAADVDADQAVTVADAVAILRRAAGIAKSAPDGAAPPAAAGSAADGAGVAQSVYWTLVDDTVVGNTRVWTAQLQAPEPVVGFSIETASQQAGGVSTSAGAAAGWLSAASSGAITRVAAMTTQPAVAQATIEMSSAAWAPGQLQPPLLLPGLAVGASGKLYRWEQHPLAGDAGDRPAPVIVRSAMYQNQPNPFNPQTSIRLELAEGGPVSLRVFDAHGRCVRTLIDGWMPTGAHVATWDGQDTAGAAVASGVYWYRIQAGAYQDVRSMTLVR